MRSCSCLIGLICTLVGLAHVWVLFQIGGKSNGRRHCLLHWSGDGSVLGRYVPVLFCCSQRQRGMSPLTITLTLVGTSALGGCGRFSGKPLKICPYVLSAIISAVFPILVGIALGAEAAMTHWLWSWGCGRNIILVTATKRWLSPGPWSAPAYFQRWCYS